MKYLVSFQIQDGDQFKIRSVLWGTPVDQEDADFYYHYLLGFQSYGVTVWNREVPESFTLSLLGANVGDVPIHFPAHDLETDAAGVTKYFTLVDRVCEMESLRSEYGIGISGSGSSSGSSGCNSSAHASSNARTEAADKAAFSAQTKYQSWVKEVMASFEEAMHTTPYNTEDHRDIAFAWMLTPVLKEIRETRGSRIVTNEDVGRHWGTKLGTDVFPDLVVSRRFSTVDWKFQHPASDALAKQAIHWYLEAQMLGTPAFSGVSQWILQADEDLAAVLGPFKHVGAQQLFSAGSAGGGTGTGSAAASAGTGSKDHPLSNILRRLEGEHILCSLTNEHILLLNQAQWEKYLRHVFRAYGISTLIIETNWGAVQDTIQTWIRGSLGICTEKPALCVGWQRWWDVLVDSQFDAFLLTLDAHDPIQSIHMTNKQKYDLGEAWIRMYVEKEMIQDEESRIPTAPFYENLRKWVLERISLPCLENPLKPVNIGPVMTILGHPVQRTKKGRMFLGLNYRNIQAVTVEPNVGPTVLSYFADTPRGDFTIVAGPELHLGSV